MKTVRRFEIWLVMLDPTKGSEIQKTRPCLVISPNEINNWLATIIIAPMTTVNRTYPSRAKIQFDGKTGQVALDQLRCIDKNRLVKKLGTASPKASQDVSEILVEMFTL